MTRVDADNDAEAEALLAKMPGLSPLIADAGNGGRYRSHDAQSSRVFPSSSAMRVALVRDEPSAQLNSDG